MSYYILPKKNIDFDIHVTISNHVRKLEPIVSFSFFYYFNKMKNQLNSIVQQEIIEKNTRGLRIKDYDNTRESDITLELLNKIMNPYEFIFSKVPGSNLSVSKLKPHSHTFYIFMEIIQMFNLLDLFEEKNISTLHYGPNSTSVVECLDMLREDSYDKNLKYGSIYASNENIFAKVCYAIPSQISNIEFLSYELLENEYKNNQKYIIGFLHILCNIIRHQSANGMAVIKIQHIFYKPILDILYILTSMYEKVYIIKPNNTNMMDSDRYIVCKNFILNTHKIVVYNCYYSRLNSILLDDTKEITSIINNDLPYFFMNKIEESNVIIGHQQLEYMDQLLSLYKNKNRDDKIEHIKKTNIQKCIQWCDKFKIPYNKFTDRVNIFLQTNAMDRYNIRDNSDRDSDESNVEHFLET